MQGTGVWSLGQEDPLEKGLATHSSIPEEYHGERSLVGYGLWGHKESDMTEQPILSLFQAHIKVTGRQQCPADQELTFSNMKC